MNNKAFDDGNRVSDILFTLTPLTDGGYAISPADKESLKGDVVIPAVYNGMTVKAISDMAFSGCRSIESIVICDGIERIENYAFTGCTSLKRITVPDSVTYIGNSVFYGCRELCSLHIPASVTEIVDNPFRLVPMNAISIDKENKHFKTDGNCIIDIPNSILVAGDETSTIPDGVAHIGLSAFKDCSAIKNIVIPHGVTHICKEAFYYCMRLSSISLPSSIRYIGEEAFYFCKALNRIDFEGTISEWYSIATAYNWDAMTGKYTVFCKDGILTKY